jgi:anti-sigma regulatory factor (Ser/Thr protein kinase)
MSEPDEYETDETSRDDGRRSGDARTPRVFSQSFPAVSASVARVRAAVGSFAALVGAGPSLVEGVRLAVSEAATNVVVHAYTRTAEPGPIHVEASVTGGELRVSVADAGPGLRSRHDSPGLGLGLAIIGELADKVDLLEGEGGLRVLMGFTLPAKPPST